MSARIIILLTFFITATARANVCDQAPDLLEEIIKRGEIRVGWISAKPFQYIDENGNLTGAFINAGNMLANRLLIVKITWVEARWDTFIAGLQSGKFDIVISNVARRPSRALSVWFTKPIALGVQALLLRKDTVAQDIADLDRPENTIVVRMGSAAHIIYTDNRDDYFKSATIKPIVPPISAEQEVASGRAVAMGAPLSELTQIARANPDWAQILKIPSTTPTTGIGFVVPHCHYNLLHCMNIFVDTLIESRFITSQVEEFPDLVLDEYVAPTTLIGDLP
jgi:ABC-type amino acid transport substrate-binding protein